MISGQNKRMRPLARRASGTKDAAPDATRRLSTMSVTALSWYDGCIANTATTNATTTPSTAAIQILEVLLIRCPCSFVVLAQETQPLPQFRWRAVWGHGYCSNLCARVEAERAVAYPAELA